MFRDEQTLRSITCLESTNFEGYNMFRDGQTLREYNMFRDEQTLRSITCLETNKL